MRNVYRILSLVGILLLTIIIQAQDIPTFTVDVGEQSLEFMSHALNVRSGASRQYTIRGVAYDRDVFTVTGRTAFEATRTCEGGYYANADMWLRIDFQGIEGWVAYCLGQFQGDLNTIPVVEPIYPVSRWEARYSYIHTTSYWHDELGIPPIHPYIVGNLRYARVNVRDTPTIDSGRVDILSSPSVYVIGYSPDKNWVRVTYLGISPFNAQWWRGAEMQAGWIAINTLFDLPEGWEDILPVIE